MSTHKHTYIEDVGEGQRRQGDVVVSHRDGEEEGLEAVEGRLIEKKRSQCIALLRQTRSRPSFVLKGWRQRPLQRQRTYKDGWFTVAISLDENVTATKAELGQQA